MQLLPEVLLHQLGGSRHTVEEGVQILERQCRRHLLATHDGIQLVLAGILFRLVLLLVDVHLVNDTTVRQFVVCQVLLLTHLRLHLRRIVGLHQLLDGRLLLLVGSHILGMHLHRTELLPVQLCREVPGVLTLVRLEGMGMRHLLAVDRHQLRLAGSLLSLLFLLVGRLLRLLGFGLLVLDGLTLFLRSSLFVRNSFLLLLRG